MREYVTPSGHVVLLDDDVVLPRRLSIGSHGYAQMTTSGEQGRMVLLHRWLMGLQRGDKRMVDHINRRPLDCRRENLRVVTSMQNSLNRTVPEREHPRHVYRTKSCRYEVRIKRYQVTRSFGTYDSIEEAVLIRNAALATYGEEPPDAFLEDSCPTTTRTG